MSDARCSAIDFYTKGHKASDSSHTWCNTYRKACLALSPITDMPDGTAAAYKLVEGTRKKYSRPVCDAKGRSWPTVYGPWPRQGRGETGDTHPHPHPPPRVAKLVSPSSRAAPLDVVELGRGKAACLAWFCGRSLLLSCAMRHARAVWADRQRRCGAQRTRPRLLAAHAHAARRAPRQVRAHNAQAHAGATCTPHPSATASSGSSLMNHCRSWLTATESDREKEQLQEANGEGEQERRSRFA